MKLAIVFILSLFMIISCSEKKKGKIEFSDEFGIVNEKAPKETIQFGQLVGKWDVISMDSLAGQGWHESKANWTFKYILDGFAVQDFWHEKVEDKTNNTVNLGRDFIGTNIRIFDPILELWQCSWFENGSNTLVSKYTARATDQGDIEMVTPDSTGLITFYNIDERHFDWKFEALGGPEKIIYSKMSATKLE